jgi:hypothetical protein
MSAPEVRAKLGACAVESVASYRLEEVAELWESTFRSCVTGW